MLDHPQICEKFLSSFSKVTIIQLVERVNKEIKKEEQSS